MGQLSEYHGHENYPTWVVAMYLDNNQSFRVNAEHMAFDTMQDEIDDGETLEEAKRKAANKLAMHLKETTDGGAVYRNVVRTRSGVQLNVTADRFDLLQPYGDLLGFVLEFVNWYAIADNIVKAVMYDLEFPED